MENEYELKANQFLEETGTKFSFKFLKWDFYFEDDKDKRDIYEITLEKGERTYTFTFGQSIAHSGEYILYPTLERIHLKINENGNKIKHIKGFGLLNNGNSVRNKEFKEPTAYDVLTCLTKNEVGTFDDFCGDYGYDNDSIKALEIYKKVCNEWNNVRILFSDEELEKLREIE